MSVQGPRVVVVGGTYIDMAFRCGEIPAAGQNVFGSELCYTTTGPGPNQAFQAVRCGCQVHLVSKLGGDPFGLMAQEGLAKLGINTDYIFTAEAMNTGVAVTLVDALGENATCHYAGANASLQTRDIEQAEQVIAMADICLIHGQLPCETIKTALRLATIHGTRVILNPAMPLEQGAHQPSDLPLEYFSADVLIPNLYEAANITEQSTANVRLAKLMGSDLVAHGARYAVITMGRRGCMVIDRNKADQVPAFKIDLVDDRGRGDAFAGALAAYCAVKGDDMKNAVEFASAAGALACTKFGSIESMPSKAAIIQLLQQET
jgi:ribokinase